MGYKFPRPSKYRVKVKRGISGLGLFALEPIKHKDFVIEYWGEVLTDEAADDRNNKYMFQVEHKKTIDGSTRKNTARYMNHACGHSSNCVAEMDGTRVFLYAKRNIKEGEELTYNYGKGHFEDHIGGKKHCRCIECRVRRRRR